jgi:hypothetical protein
MLRIKKRLEKNELKAVYDAIEEYIFEHHKLCSITEISQQSGLSKSECRKNIGYLVKEGEIYEAFKSGKTNPIVYIPTYMMDEILVTQKKPGWLEEYSFVEKKSILEEIEKCRENITLFEMFERLLYATNTPLEEAVAFALEWLGFKDVQHLKDSDAPDIKFKHNDKLFLVEVKGITGQGKKEYVAQLDTWIRKEMDEDRDPEKLVGVLVVNHFRTENPKERGEPLTDFAKKYLKRYEFKFFTTCFLFDLINKVEKKGNNQRESKRRSYKR